MTIRRKVSYLIPSFAILALTSHGFAQEDDAPFSASLNGSYIYDSNITVDAIDTTTNVGDNGIIIDGALGYEILNNDDVGINVGYNYYNSSYTDVKEFNMLIHGFNTDIRYSRGGIDYGMTYLFNTIKLGGTSFLSMNTIRPNVGYLLGSNKVYLTGGFEFQKQKFKSEPLQGRDANKKSIFTKAIFLLGEGRIANIGYTYSDHNTTDVAYSYNGHVIDISVKLPFDFMDKTAIFKTGYRLTSRKYDPASIIYADEIRSDNRHSIKASIEMPIKYGFSARFEHEYISSKSTYLAVDYKEKISTVSVGWEF